MKARSIAIKNRMIMGQRDLTKEKPSIEEEKKLEDDVAINKQLADIQRAEEMLSKLSLEFFPPILNRPKKKIFTDGAEEPYQGYIEKDFFADHTGKNKIRNLRMNIIDASYFPDHPRLLFHIIFDAEASAIKWRTIFSAKKLAMPHNKFIGTHACGFTDYASFEQALKTLEEAGDIISKSNTDDFLNNVKTFMQGRGLLTAKAEKSKLTS